MKISIIITTYNNRGLLRQLLRGILKFPPSLPYEIIVVDNGSNDKTSDLISNEFPTVIYIRLTENKGLAVGNNAGIRLSKGEYILILNPDVAIFENRLNALIAFMDAHPQAGIVAPKLLNPDHTLQYSTYTFPHWYTPILRRTPIGKFPASRAALKTYIMKDWDHLSDKKVDWVLGAAMLIRKSCFDKIGLQDESFFLYFEDVDLCRRCWVNGFEVWYAHAIHFIHYHRRESAENPGWRGLFLRITKIHISSWITYQKKYYKVPLPKIRL